MAGPANVSVTPESGRLTLGTTLSFASKYADPDGAANLADCQMYIGYYDPEAVEPPPRAQAPSPCDACADKPCLAACPVGAFTVEGYDVPRCAAFLETDAGEDCMTRACRARRACPVAPGRAQAPDQARFHMAAFRRGARRGAGSA